MPVYMRGFLHRTPDCRHVPFVPSPLRRCSRADPLCSSQGAQETLPLRSVISAAPPVANCMTAQIVTCTVPQLAPRAVGKMHMGESESDADDDDLLNDWDFLNDLSEIINGEDEDRASRLTLFKEQRDTFASFERSYSVLADWHEKEMAEFQRRREMGVPLVDDIDAYLRSHFHRARCAFVARPSGDLEKYQARKVSRIQARAQAEAAAEARAWLASGGVVDEAVRRARLRAQGKEDKSHPVYRNRQTWKRRYEAMKAAEVAKAKAEATLAQERGEMSEEEVKKKAVGERARKARADKRACDRAKKDAERARKFGHAFPSLEKENMPAQQAATVQDNGPEKVGPPKRQRLPAKKPTPSALLGVGKPGGLRSPTRKPTPPALSTRAILGSLSF
ncbi:uncharacterized protein SCHCODRAFT_02501705 [Schizophyllum commune H4-8]|uniref:uncharacterized protein n=1 Tax=Schizophyllum commune (strain H4-8 / FGSC 9210) TaxID=578458 RepID=UPI0021604C5D|nr:uncharacterized protein SCHCODRAFT_02501705 [Schizophyllum commune H4-8]KAI5891972.1 hypothetical protein SCHCODRAFT_02501705 [Schizophyllum commune H4-8]